MNIKKGDKIIVITGSDKGKKSVVVRSFPATNKILVEKVNIKKIHKKAKSKGAKGEIVEMAMPIDASNVMLLESSTGKRTRISKKMISGKYVRVSTKGGNEI